MKAAMTYKNENREQLPEYGHVRMELTCDLTHDEIISKMNKHNVFAFLKNCAVTYEGYEGIGAGFTAESERVKGYFINASGNEAASSDVEDFILDTLVGDSKLVIEGSYRTVGEKTVVSISRYMVNAGQILVDLSRCVIEKDGTKKPMRGLSELRDFEIENAQKESGNVVCFPG